MGTDERDGLKRFLEFFTSLKRAPEGGLRSLTRPT
jgi:hypothetical protein